MNISKKSRLRLACLLALLLPVHMTFAQEFTFETEEDAEEVDRILLDLDAEAEAEPVETEAQPETETEFVAEPSDEFGEVEAAEPAEAEAAQPGDVPSIQLERDADLPGLAVADPDRGRDSLISITYDDVMLADVVRIFARFSGANIIIPEGLNESVSANLNDVDWRDALEAILAEKDYALVQRRAGIFTIVREDQLATEPLGRETLELQYITVEQALPAVQGMITSSNARVIPLPAANRIVVVETQRNIADIREVIAGVDQPRQQVFIEAKFVELNDQAIKDLGINWQVLQGYTIRASGMSIGYDRMNTLTDMNELERGTTDTSSNTRRRTSEGDNIRTTLRDGTSVQFTDANDPANNVSTSGLNAENNIDNTAASRRFSETLDETTRFNNLTRERTSGVEREIARSAVLSATDFALTLSALQQLDGVRMVSNPKMLVASGETANIHVGRNEPNIRAVPQGENATTFAYVLDGFIEIGVKLQVTPVVSTERNITVRIIPELSRLIGEKSVGEAGTSFPITQTRRIETEFALLAGKTVAIGGLTQGEDREVVRKVPLLGDLPLVGRYLFRHTRTERFQDEVIIFVSVDMAHTEELNDRDGIPQHGDLIHRWMQQEEARQGAATME